ncbi:MAG: GtrA family protein [Variovorax sp.]|jgi:putative flippase GtrA|nr:MAG: GtrA family protein [Variovorax sp.]
MRPLMTRLAGYVVTGGAAAIVDAGGFAVLTLIGIPALPAAIASFALAAILNFQLSARFVFKHAPTGRAFMVFLAAALVGLTVNVGVTLLILRHVDGVPAVLAKIGGIGVAFFVNFVLNQWVVFRASR